MRLNSNCNLLWAEETPKAVCWHLMMSLFCDLRAVCAWVFVCFFWCFFFVCVCAWVLNISLFSFLVVDRTNIVREKVLCCFQKLKSVEEMPTHSSALAQKTPWTEATVHGVVKSRTHLSNFIFFLSKQSWTTWQGLTKHYLFMYNLMCV